MKQDNDPTINDKTNNNKHLSDEQLLSVYFKEAKPNEVDACLKNPQACQQLDQLEQDMQLIEQTQSKHQHDLPDDYSQQLWQQIADKLPPESNYSSKQQVNWLQRLKDALLMPQFSIASLVLVTGIVMVAFFAGRQQAQDAFSSQSQAQLLAQNIQLHLTQSEIFLTQVNNGGGINTQATAQRLLTSNRLFKQALSNHEGQFTNQLLQNLEPILLEFANQPLKNSTQQIHGQQPQANWVNDSQSNDLSHNLMFQIKAVKQKLAQNNDII